MDGYVAKPCSPDSLWAELQRALARNQERLPPPADG